MKCEYWWINYHVKHELGKLTPIKHCENEDARYSTCDFVDAIVCKECSCRCYKNCPPMTDEDIKELIEARDERHKRWEEKQRNKVVDSKE